jgi:hypothetical protein
MDEPVKGSPSGLTISVSPSSVLVSLISERDSVHSRRVCWRTIELVVSGHDRSRKEERMSRLIRHAWASWARIDSERRWLTLTLGHRSSLAQEDPSLPSSISSFSFTASSSPRRCALARPFDRPALNTNDRHFLPPVDVFRRRWPLNFNSPSRFACTHSSVAPRHHVSIRLRFADRYSPPRTSRASRGDATPAPIKSDFFIPLLFLLSFINKTSLSRLCDIFAE